MSKLSDKIFSYSPEQYIRFNTAYSTTPTNLGSAGTGTWTLSNEPPVLNATGGPDGEGSWISSLGSNSDSTTTRFRASTSTAAPNLNLLDDNYSVGFWFKTNFTLTNSLIHDSTYTIHATSVNGRAVTVSLYGASANATNKGKLFVSTNVGGSFYSPNRVDDQQWHYVAIRRNKPAASLVETIYLDGQLLGTATSGVATGTAVTEFGDTTTVLSNNGAIDATSFEYSNYYSAPFDAIDATDISQIWQVYTQPAGDNLYFADPMTANITIPNAVQTTQSDKILDTVIASYNPEIFVKFSEPYIRAAANTPANYGSDGATGGWGTLASTISPSLQVYTTESRHPDSYVFYYGGSAGGGNVVQGPTGTSMNDNSFSAGIWFKTNFTLSDTLSHKALLDVWKVGIPSEEWQQFSIRGEGAGSTVKGRISFYNGVYDGISTKRVDDQQWHYLAYRAKVITSTNIQYEIYLDGEPLKTGTSVARASYNGGFSFGGAGDGTLTGSLEQTSFEVSTAYIAPYASVDAAAIQNLNAIGQAQFVLPPGVSVSHTAEPMSVTTSTVAMPTIVAVIGDHVEITTSILVDAYIPEPSFSAGENVTVSGSFETINATAPDNYILETNRDVVFDTTFAEAFASIPEPLVAQQPMKANAILPEPVVYVSPNYFSLVKNLNPVFYIEDGQVTPVNHGTWNVSSYEVIDGMLGNVQAGEEMNVVGNQKAWMAPATGLVLTHPELRSTIANYPTILQNLYDSRNLSIEIWYVSQWVDGPGGVDFGSGPLFTDGITMISEVFDNEGPEATYKPVLISERVQLLDEAGNPSIWRTYSTAEPKAQHWNHLVVTYEAVPDPNFVRRLIYLNSAIVGNELLEIVKTGESSSPGKIKWLASGTSTGPQLGGVINLSGSQILKLEDNVKLDEFAIYPVTMSGTQVVEHYNFIKSLTPDDMFNASPYYVDAQMGNHIVSPVANVLYQESPFSSLSRIVEPTFYGGKTITINADPLDMLASMQDALASYDTVIAVEFMSSYAEKAPAYALNSIYADYVNSHIFPYRYVNFDSADVYLDQGSDEKYAVDQILVFGDVVNPDEGINGKSVKSAGQEFTDGVILMESEYNDNWGTGLNNYHSSFWMQRAVDDQSTGLRVLWNLNGYYDDQHVILYQYQNKLYLNFNNGSGTHIEQATVANINLFDYNRHFIAIDFNHTGANAFVRLYVDAVLVMTVNLGTYAGSTINSPTFLAPNDPNNNFPRLGIGSLITPFEVTAIPVIPTNTKIYVDEIIWAKSELTQALATALYTTLPGKVNTVNLAAPMLVSSLQTDVAISTEINKTAFVFEGYAQLIDPMVHVEFNNSVTATAITADALMVDTMRSDSVNIVSDIMLASASIGGAGTPRIIPATPMFASNAQIAHTKGIGLGIKVNGVTTFEPYSIWARRITSQSVMTPIREIA